MINIIANANKYKAYIACQTKIDIINAIVELGLEKQIAHKMAGKKVANREDIVEKIINESLGLCNS